MRLTGDGAGIWQPKHPKISVAPGATRSLFRPESDPGCLYAEDPALIGTLFEHKVVAIHVSDGIWVPQLLLRRMPKVILIEDEVMIPNCYPHREVSE